MRSIVREKETSMREEAATRERRGLVSRGGEGEGRTLEALDEILASAGGGILVHAEQRVDHARGHGLAL